MSPNQGLPGQGEDERMCWRRATQAELEEGEEQMRRAHERMQREAQEVPIMDQDEEPLRSPRPEERVQRLLDGPSLEDGHLKNGKGKGERSEVQRTPGKAGSALHGNYERLRGSGMNRTTPPQSATEAEKDPFFRKRN